MSHLMRPSSVVVVYYTHRVSGEPVVDSAYTSYNAAQARADMLRILNLDGVGVAITSLTGPQIDSDEDIASLSD